MATILESSQDANAGLAAGLQAATAQISAEQTYTFNLYKRLVLPVDGYVFYVLASAIDPEFLAIYGARPFNQTPQNALMMTPLTPVQAAAFSFTVNGSLHLSQTSEQDSEAFVSRQTAAFTVKDEVQDFAAIAPDEMFIMTLPNGFKVAFANQTMRYQQAGLWHYSGRALLPYEATQVVDDPSVLDVENSIVSNSMPLWIGMSTPQLPIFPANLSPFNMMPPYITADITETQGIGQSPVIDPFSSQSQLVQEKVRFTLWGTRNDAALDFQQTVLQNSLDGSYGVMNIPVPVDEKKTQAEFGIIAQKKAMDLQVNYYQSRTRDIARKIISSAFITLTED